jgi:hypothetical protein
MMKPCTVPRCPEMATGFSTLCDNHKKAQRRHGEAIQTGVTVHQLRPYMARVAARQAKNTDNQSWRLIGDRWAAAVADAKRVIDAAHSGVPFMRPQYDAAIQLVHLNDTVPANDVMAAALAMFLYREDQPRRFKSDRAFDFQLVRRVRGLSPQAAGSYWDNNTKKTKKVYKDMAPRVIEAIAVVFKETFGLAGLMLARLENAEAERARQTGRELGEALEALT